MPFSAKSLLKDSGVELQKASVDKFGSVVEDFAKGGLGGLLPKVDPKEAADRSDKNTWNATSYAAALAGGTNFRPKLKFMFKVEFIFTKEAKALYNDVFGSAKANDFTFMIKMIDRPKVDFEYEEDVNMYNFRTKVLKKIIHRDLTMQIMDDVGNRVFDFFRYLMAIHSPVVRGQFNRDGTLQPPVGTSVQSGSGMSWLQGLGVGQNNAHRAAVNSAFGNSIECIRVKQIFTDTSKGTSDMAQMVSFDFVNPRIVSFDLDELAHEANDVNTLTMVFGYDWMEMVNVGSLNGVKDDYDKNKYTVRAPGSTAPLDITPGKPGSSASPGGQKKQQLLGGFVGKQLDKATKELTSDLIGKGVKAIAGNSKFANALGNRVAGKLIGPLGGLASTSLRGGISNFFSNTSNPLSRSSSSSPVKDGSVAGGGNATTVSSVSDPNGGP